MKELAMYNVFNNLNPIHIENPKDKNATASVNTLISKFVLELQENYPSTVKTVVKIGDKLTCDKTGNVCKMCKVRFYLLTLFCLYNLHYLGTDRSSREAIFLRS